MDRTGTIAAISTPAGEGGIGIVRISGPGALTLAQRLFRTPTGAPVADPVSHAVRHGWVIHPSTGKRMDEVLFLYMKAPHSYTGEDVVEFQGHGGTQVTVALLQAVLEAGAVPASPGEFTRRAFLNGRIDLSQAEAVIELIRAKTDEAQQASLLQLSGGLSREILGLKEDLMTLTAEVEASLDFDEDEFGGISFSDLAAGTRSLGRHLTNLLARSREGALFQEGIKVVIAGRPNVGKSSLLNALLDEPRAIVTPHPGTTRDTVEGCLNLRGVPVRLVDCAGIHATQCAVESEGVRRSLNEVETSTIVMAVLDSSEPIGEEDLAILRLIRDKRAIIVLNKSDLGSIIWPQDTETLFPGRTAIRISCSAKEGLEELREAIIKEAFGGAGISGNISLTANVRQREALRRAVTLIAAAEDALANGQTPDAAAADLRLALDTLGEITGETATDDILDRIFSRFCIGK